MDWLEDSISFCSIAVSLSVSLLRAHAHTHVRFVLFLHSPILFLALCREFSFSSETLHTFSASELTFSLQLHDCRDRTGFSCHLIWSFIKSCFKHGSCSFVAGLQTDDLLRRDRMGKHPAVSAASCICQLGPACRCPQLLEPKQIRWAKFYYSTHLKLNKLKIGVDPQIILQPLLSEVCIPRVVPV